MIQDDIRNQVKGIVDQFKYDKTALLAILREVQDRWRFISLDVMSVIADELDLPLIHVEGTATFYHFLSTRHAGKYTVYVNTSATAEMAGVKQIIDTFESELGISMGSNSDGNQIGLRKTSCIGMSDQEPALLINGVVFTKVTQERVKELVKGMNSNVPIQDLVQISNDHKARFPWILSEVSHSIRVKGPVFFAEYTPGLALKKAMELGSLDVIEEIKRSGLRGRGGAGFPAGQKWATCRATEADKRYVICNCDEGEPGTFKDRVLLTELPEMIFEGMVLAGYAVEAKEGILYLRGEYLYLRDHLEKKLDEMRKKKRLGKKIFGTRFSFDIQIKVGAGAYICGEESSLIESAEGKRGQPRNRPPFPVVSGYLGKPTVVNNPETLCSAVKIILNGADWFRKMGTSASPGVKLLSIAGDCQEPGIYELEWGKTIREVLELCGAKDTLAVQVGGPSGVCVSEAQWDRKICYSDLPTGGAFTVFSKERNLLSIVLNHMEFFKEESCGFCIPCRSGNVLLVKALEKIKMGNGTALDLEGIQKLGKMIKSTSRCGLGQTSPNPLLTSIENFKDFYLSQVRKDVDYLSQFNLSYAVTESCGIASHITKKD